MPQIFGKTSKAIPTAVADGTFPNIRSTTYGELVTTQLMDNHNSLADEGSYFKATNATPGTAITHATTAAFSSTAAALCIFNSNAAGGKRIYLDYFRLIVVGTPTTATSAQMVITLDTGNRLSSGGTTLTAACANMDSSRTSGATITFGAVVLTAASGSVRQVGRHTFKTQATPCLAVGDILAADFGDATASGATLAGTTPLALPYSSGPIVIGGGHSLNVHLYYPAVTVAPTYEVEIAFWER